MAVFKYERANPYQIHTRTSLKSPNKETRHAVNRSLNKPTKRPLCQAWLMAVSVVLTLITFCAGTSVALADVYVYVRADGSKLITDQRQSNSGDTLVKTYKTSPYRSRSNRAPYLETTIKSQYDALIVNTALQFDLEPAFIKAVVHVESAFDRHAVSRVGAMGLMQLMPATAAMYELNKDHFDARKNLLVGVQHMKELMERYQSDKRLSLAAYNAGEGAVQKFNGVPPYQETQNYVAKVLRLYALYQREI